MYKPQIEGKKQQTVNSAIDTEKLKIDLSENVTEAFMQRFDELEQKIEQLKVSQTQRKSSQVQSKKDGDEA